MSGERFEDVARAGTLSRFWRGAGFAASGIAFTVKHPRVLKWAVVPMLVQSAIFIAVMFWGVRFLDGVVDWVGIEPGHWYSFMESLLWLACLVVLLLFGILFTLLVGGVVCDPFYDLVSEETEAVLIGRAIGEPFSIGRAVRGIVRELGVTLVRTAVYLAVALPLWIVGLTGVGSVVAAPLALAWTWSFVALEGLSRSQARHTLATGARLSAVSSQKSLALGFGALGWVMAYIPLTAPFLVVGGTRLFLALAAHDRVPSRLTDPEKAGLRA